MKLSSFKHLPSNDDCAIACTNGRVEERKDVVDAVFGHMVCERPRVPREIECSALVSTKVMQEAGAAKTTSISSHRNSKAYLKSASEQQTERSRLKGTVHVHSHLFTAAYRESKHCTAAALSRNEQTQLTLPLQSFLLPLGSSSNT